MTKEIIHSMLDKALSLELELVWIPKIMARQTEQEKNREDTEEKNGIGLNSTHAPFITNLYKQIQDGHHLTDKQTGATKKILKHYWKQYDSMMKT